MIIKVDRVQSIEEINTLSNFNTQNITLSLCDQVEPERHFNFKLFKFLKDVQFQGKLGIYYNPHLNSIEDSAKAIDTGWIDYVQIDYSQLNHPNCTTLYKRYIYQVSFVCDSIIADSDSEPSWVQFAIEDAINWGCDLSILNLFSDRYEGWTDFVGGKFDLLVADLENLLAKYKIGICCNFQPSDVHTLSKYSDNLTINLKLHNSSQHGHYHTFNEVTAILAMDAPQG